MAAINFPSNPTTGQTFVHTVSDGGFQDHDIVYKWDGTSWIAYNDGTHNRILTQSSTINVHSDVDTSTISPQATDVLTWTANSTWEPQEASGGSSTLVGLTDVVFPGTLYDGDTIFWRNSSQTWENVPLFDGNFNSLSNKPNMVNLGDVSYSNVGMPQTNNVLVWTANNVWEPQQQSGGGGGGATTLDGLTDVDTTTNTPSTNAVLTFTANNVWEAQLAPSGGGATNLDGLTDTTISAPSSGQFLRWIGSTWLNTSASLEDLSDVTINSSQLQYGQYLTYNGNNWVNLTPAVYNNDNVNYHLNQSDAVGTVLISSGTILSWNGTDYEWVSNSGGGSSISILSDLTDVSTNVPNSGDVLTWNVGGGPGSWTPTAPYVDSDVDTHLNQSLATAGQILSWSGTDYAWVAQGGGTGGSSTLSGLTDTTINQQASGEYLKWTGSTWENYPISMEDLNNTGGSVSSPNLNDVLIFTANNTWDNYPMDWGFVSNKPVIVDPEGTPSSTGPVQWTYNANSAYDVSSGPQNYIFSVYNDNGYTWQSSPSYTFLFKLANSTPQWIQDYLAAWPVDHKFTIVIRNTFHVSQWGSGVPNGVHFECHAKMKEFSWGSSQVNRYIRFDPTESYSSNNMIDWMNGGAWGIHDFWLEIYDGWGETSGAPYLNRLAMDFKTSTLTPNTSDVLTWTANNTWEPQVAESVSDTNFWKKQASKTFNLLPQGTGGGTGYYWRLEYGGSGNADGYVSSGPLDDDTNPDLYVTPGETICFKLDNSSVNGSIHPVHIRTNASTSTTGTNFNEHLVHYDDSTGIYSEGSSAQGKTTGYLYWTVPYSIGTNYGSSSYGSTTYHYQSGADNSFTGKFVIRDIPSFDSGITPSSNDVLTWTANNTWEPQQSTSGGGTPSQITKTTGSNTVHLTANTASNRFDYNAHFIPTSNASYDLGNAEYKVRHLFLSDNSLWIGDEHKMSIEGGKVKTKKRKKSVWPSSITTHVGWGPGASLENASAISWINTTFSKTYTEVSELNLRELLSVLEYLNGNWTSVDAELIVTVSDLFPPESDSGNYSHDDYDEIFSNEQEGRRIADPKGNLNTLEINLRATRSYFLEQSPNYDPGGDLTVNFHGAAPVPGATLDFTIFISNGMHPKNISSINVNGVAATQVRTSGITPSSFEMNTYTIKGVCDSSLNWLLTNHVA